MIVALACCVFAFQTETSTQPETRTTAEFREYAAEKLSGLSDRKLDAIVNRVDTNADGVISNEEFAQRLKIFREVKSGPEPWETDLAEARARSASSGKPLLIFARADWCAVCQLMEKQTLPTDTVQRALSEYVILKLDVTNAKAFEEEAEPLKIDAIPAFIVEANGKEEDRSLGATKPGKLVEWLNKYSGAVNQKTLRVLRYNIHHGAGVDGKLDLERIAKVILSTKPDIVALQEVDRFARRSGNVDQAKKLAKLTRMHFAFGPNIKLGEGDYGNAVLSRFPLRVRKNHQLPNIDNGEQRGVLDVDVRTPTGPIRFLATHFDHRKPDEERLASARFVDTLLKRELLVPTLLAGDLNATPESEPLRLLGRHWHRPDGVFPTIPVKSPTRQIDFVIAAKRTDSKFVESKVVAEPVASDHRPLLVVITVANQQHTKSGVAKTSATK
ncbi:MAG: endonuclease/exonuclease/phosphatase family protein [Planctomycetaceae bacterium]